MGLSTPRYEEMAQHKMELEEAKRENEALRRKVRELEAALRGRRSSSVTSSVSERRGRSGRQSEEVVRSGGEEQVEGTTLPLR